MTAPAWAEIGQRIRRRRIELGWSQDCLAWFGSIGRSTLVAWEAGHCRPTTGALGYIAAALACAPADLDPEGLARRRSHPMTVLASRQDELVSLALARRMPVVSLVDEALDAYLDGVCGE